MNISFKSTGKIYQNRGETFHLYINDKKVNDSEYRMEEGYLVSGELRAENLILRFYNEACMEFPDKLKIACYINDKPLNKLDYGYVSDIGLAREGDTFTVRLSAAFDEDEKMSYYINPPLLLQHAVAIANNNGMEQCKCEEHLDDFTAAYFYYRSPAEESIGLKIEEARAILNIALQTAAREIHEIIGAQLFPGKTKKEKDVLKEKVKLLEQQLEGLKQPAIFMGKHESTLLRDIASLNEATINRLKGADIHTVDDLRGWTRNDLLKLRGFGPACLKNLEEAISLLKS